MKYGLLCSKMLPADTGNRYMFTLGGDTAAEQIRTLRAVASSADKASVTVGAAGNFPVTDFTGRHMTRARITPTALFVSADNDPETTSPVTPAVGAVRVRIGALANPASAFYWQGKMRDIVVTGPLSFDQGAKLKSYLLAKRNL